MRKIQLTVAIILVIALIIFYIYAYNLVDRTPIIQMVSKIENLENVYGFAYKGDYIVALYKDDTEKNILEISNCYLRRLQYDNGKLYLVSGESNVGTNAKVYCIDLESNDYILKEICKNNIYTGGNGFDKHFFALDDSLYFVENKQNIFRIIKYDTIAATKTILKEIDEKESVFTSFGMFLDKENNTLYYSFYKDNHNYSKNIQLPEEAEIHSMNLVDGTDKVLIKDIVQTGSNFDCDMKVVDGYIYYYGDRDKDPDNDEWQYLRDIYRYNIKTKKSELIPLKETYLYGIDTIIPYNGGYIHVNNDKDSSKTEKIIMENKDGTIKTLYEIKSDEGHIIAYYNGISMISKTKLQFMVHLKNGNVHYYLLDLNNNAKTKIDKPYRLSTFI